MSIIAPILFALVGLAAMLVISRCVASNVDAVLELKRQVAMAAYGSEVIVNFREPELDLDPMSNVRRPRQSRHALPKPITHRLHQFAKPRSVA
ncbi:hypothetical protein HNO88_002331 [Novosphingobium chloroacetimidivorans]|uniref:Uncharacterized protein n=1 Tax=Novosphingobium chloroacetimidivorans TaxID=1428314 RepID=A0A7W7KAI3_9SPHN|nr:hypothetical protein [Novosphingobium chloroacetimidivorans]MBB4859005.1 hypothetical protein [Novosphingobium chloroacetimidivorans]